MPGFTLCLGGEVVSLVLGKDLGLWSHVDLVSNPKRLLSGGWKRKQSEEVREGRERSQWRLLSSGFTLWAAEGAADWRALGDTEDVLRVITAKGWDPLTPIHHGLRATASGGGVDSPALGPAL